MLWKCFESINEILFFNVYNYVTFNEIFKPLNDRSSEIWIVLYAFILLNGFRYLFLNLQFRDNFIIKVSFLSIINRTRTSTCLRLFLQISL